jgi:ACS family hexuronate transporter-like MFS transporter
MIIKDRGADSAAETETADIAGPRWFDLLKLPQTWGILVARAFTDPVWYFITDWFMIFLVSKGFKPEATLIAFWIPFVAADLGNFAGGGFSSWLIRRGWSVGRARKAVVLFGGAGMMMLIPTLFASSLFGIAGLFALATFAYAAFSTMALVLPSDLFQSRAVATISGMSGTAASVLTIISTFWVGWISDQYSFGPILVVASLVPPLGAALVVALIRNTSTSGTGVLRTI